MSGGFTPFDRNSYRESKRRRKQALIEERTGRILPVSNPRRRYIALACIGVILVVAIAFGIFSILKSNQKSNPETPEQIQAESEMLLTVVDSANPLDKDYVPDLETVNGFKVNRDALKPLENLLKASKENGTELKIKTAYVSYDEQEERFQSELQKMLQSSKYTTVRAEAEVLKPRLTEDSRSHRRDCLLNLIFQIRVQRHFLSETALNTDLFRDIPKAKPQ